MPRIEYVRKDFGDAALGIIERADQICRAYAAQGFDLTLRQLYYQFVARGFIPNKDTEYKRLGAIINDARLAGLLDWKFIVDRTRNIKELSHWESPADIIETTSKAYNRNLWADQIERVEVWIEKDALVGMIEGVCKRNDVAFFSCRGYTSQSEMWGAAQRLESYIDEGANMVTIIHLGDHDPSGIDMSRDILDRLTLFMDVDGYDAGGGSLDLRRIALNMDQVRHYNPPPNPAKLTDSRVRSYISHYGSQSWELDALDPRVLDSLIQAEIEGHRDEELWDAAVAVQAEHRKGLLKAAKYWGDVVSFLDDKDSPDDPGEPGE